MAISTPTHRPLTLICKTTHHAPFDSARQVSMHVDSRLSSDLSSCVAALDESREALRKTDELIGGTTGNAAVHSRIGRARMKDIVERLKCYDLVIKGVMTYNEQSEALKVRR